MVQRPLLWLLGLACAFSAAAGQPEQTMPAGSESVEKFNGQSASPGSRRYALLFGPDLNVNGAVTIPPEVGLSVAFPRGRIPVDYPVPLNAQVEHIFADELAVIDFLDGEEVVATLDVPAFPFVKSAVWGASAIGTRQLRARVTDTDGVQTLSSAVPSVVFLSEVKGEIQGFATQRFERFISGWACSTGFEGLPIQVELRFESTLHASYTANAASDVAIATACDVTAGGYRFRIPITDAMYQAHTGEFLSMRGVSPVAPVYDAELQGSGTFKINEHAIIESLTVRRRHPGAELAFGEPVVIDTVARDIDADGCVNRIVFMNEAYEAANIDPPSCANPAAVSLNWQAAWGHATPGVHRVNSRARDNRNVFGPVSELLEFSIAQVSIEAPIAGTGINEGDAVQLTARAEGFSAAVVHVDFHADADVGAVVPTESNRLCRGLAQGDGRFGCSWTANRFGSLQVVAIAHTASDQVPSESITLNVNRLPRVSTLRARQARTGPELIAGIPTTIEAFATDADGQVARVRFFSNRGSGPQTLGDITSQTSTPDGLAFVYPWPAPAAGAAQLTARARDNLNAWGPDSAPLAVSFAQIAVTAPQSGQVFTHSASLSIPLQANAAHFAGVVHQVRFLATDGSGQVVDACAQGSPVAGTNNYSCNWSQPAAASYSVIARAVIHNAQGQQVDTVDSPPITIVVNALPTAQFVSVTQVRQGSELVAGLSSKVRVTASDPDGSIQAVEAEISGPQSRTLTLENSNPGAGQFDLNWTDPNAVAGTYGLRVRAKDDRYVWGPFSTSQAVHVAGLSHQVPVLVNTGTTVTLIAQATGFSGRIHRVSFYHSGSAQPLCSVLNLAAQPNPAPFSLSCNWTVPQSHHGTREFWSKAEVGDAGGPVVDEVESARSSLTVNDRPSLAPAPSIPAPRFAPNHIAGELSVQATAQDAVGGLKELRSSLTGASDCVATYNPPTTQLSTQNCTFSDSGAGTLSLTVRATDAHDVQTMWSATREVVPRQPVLGSVEVLNNDLRTVKLNGSNLFTEVRVVGRAQNSSGDPDCTVDGLSGQGTWPSSQWVQFTVPQGCASLFDNNGVYFWLENRTPNFAAGASWQSADSVLVKRNDPPTVSIVAPATDGASFPLGTVVGIAAEASDDEGVVSVTFAYSRVNTSIWTNIDVPDTEPPYVVHWSTAGLASGQYQLRAIASDGSATDTAVRAVSLTSPPGTIDPPVAPQPNTASDSVGATAGEFRVDEAGAATYRVPIYAAPGTAGVAPEIALAYSSQGGNGVMGIGWSITGLSAISRCRATPEAGDAVSELGPITLSSGDRFCLDGQRLLEVSNSGMAACPSQSGHGARQLRTEIESFQRVCAYTPTNSSNGPRFFTVQRKDGSTSWYGDRAASSTLRDGYLTADSSDDNSAIFHWALTRQQDSTGNYIDYTYFKDPGPPGRSGELLIKRVSYTGKIALAGQTSTHAPYAHIEFVYADVGEAAYSRSYLAGHALWSTRRLDKVRSKDGDTTLREYHLTYKYSASPAARAKVLTKITECRDDQTNAVCLKPTEFTWSRAEQDFQALGEVDSIPYFDSAEFESLKFADVDGDGRQDLLWIKDGTGGSCTTEKLYVLAGRLNNQGRPYFDASTTTNNGICLPHELPVDRNSGWFLLDYDGDGREDLFVRGATRWHGYRSLGLVDGQLRFDQSDLLYDPDPVRNVDVPIPASSDRKKPEHQPQLADFNGDGLLDIVYPKDVGGEIKLFARLMERQAGGGFAWGPELPLDPFSEGIDPCTDVPTCTGFKILGLYRKLNYQQLADFDGDGRSDLLVVSQRIAQCSGGEPPGDPPPIVIPNADGGRSPTTSSACASEVWAHTIRLVSPSRIDAAPHGAAPRLFFYVDDADTFDNAFNVSFSDINGDGLSDMVATGTETGYPRRSLNTGTGFALLTDECANCAELAAHRHTQVLDVNGDGRADLVYPIAWPAGQTTAPTDALRYFVVRYGQPNGDFGPRQSLTDNRLSTGCTATTRANQLACLAKHSYLFGDYNGDGALDFVRIEWDGSNAEVQVAQSIHPDEPRDVITDISNGLGAVTKLTYRPLTNSAVYRRRSGSRNDEAIGRGSPVADFLSPMQVVARASSSAPTLADPQAKAAVYYRYVGARMQAGGRGFLGFEEIHTIDANHANAHVLTISAYRYDFPFVGMPDATDKWLVSGPFDAQAEGCFEPGSVDDTCFLTPGEANAGFSYANAQPMSQSESDWTSSPAFVPGNPVVPHQVRLRKSEDRTYDPADGTLLSTVVNDFSAYDSFGNVLAAATRTYAGSDDEANLLSTVSTANLYSNHAASWHLGRLTSSVVTHTRQDLVDPQVLIAPHVRTTAFGYHPVTGMLVREEVRRGGAASDNLVTYYTLDEYGNRRATHTCSGELIESVCTGNFQFQSPASPLRIQRYSRQVFDSKGRYVTEAWERFASGEQRTLYDVVRDDFGNVIKARDVNGTLSQASYGSLGRAHYSWTQTSEAGHGLNSTVVYAWCDGAIACPTGAAYRQTSQRDAAPTSWTWFDALARPVLSAAQTFNQSGNEQIAGVCTAYDTQGRTERVSEPFTLPGDSEPVLNASTCAQASRHWTHTRFDTIGRVTSTTAPDGSTLGMAYAGFKTTITDALLKTRSETRNALGELVLSVDANSFEMNYQYDHTGNLRRVWRKVGNALIETLSTYDASGRKESQTDPDAGFYQYTYNALGEQISQTDDNGVTGQLYDARGRVYQRNIAGGVTHLYSFDTEQPGSLYRESSSGSYAVAAGDPAMNLDFNRTYSHDGLGRLRSTRTEIDGLSHLTLSEYDLKGRVWKQQDASGRWLKTVFTNRGFAEAVCEWDPANPHADCLASAYQRSIKVDARGNVTEEQRYNSQVPATPIKVLRSYYPRTGRMQSIQGVVGNATPFYQESYVWDNAGNLESRTKAGQYSEYFGYDDLHRLTEARLLNSTNGPLSLEMYYDRLGNICAKRIDGALQGYSYQGVGGCGGVDTAYGSSGNNTLASPHAVTRVGNTDYAYDGHGNQTSASRDGYSRSIRYNSENQAFQIVLNASSFQRSRFWYGSDGQRYLREDYTGSGGTRRTQYLGNVEIITQGDQLTLRRYVAGVAVQDIVNNVPTTKYLFHDHLGSVVRVTTHGGGVESQLDYGPFGERRAANDPIHGIPLTPSATNRGFTGHEMLDGLDIVHMNGRIYDSRIARFLQADPIIQEPNNPQNFNRYTYVWNNPLNATDPSGYSGRRNGDSDFARAVKLTFAVVISYATGGALSGWAGTWASGAALSAASGYTVGFFQTGSGQGGLQGAYSAVLFFAAGQIAGNIGGPDGLGQGHVGRAILHGFAGGTSEVLAGGSFGDGFVSAGMSKVLMGNFVKGTGPGSMVAAAMIGGTVSAATGGKFANGAVTAAMQFGLNQMSKQAQIRKLEALITKFPHLAEKINETNAKSLNTSDGYPQEHGFYAYQRHDGKELIYLDMPEGVYNEKEGRATIPEHTPFALPGHDMVLVYHTHPFNPCSGLLGCALKNLFSDSRFNGPIGASKRDSASKLTLNSDLSRYNSSRSRTAESPMYMIGVLNDKRQFRAEPY